MCPHGRVVTCLELLFCHAVFLRSCFGIPLLPASKYQTRVCRSLLQTTRVTRVDTSTTLADGHGFALERRVRPTNAHLRYHRCHGNEAKDAPEKNKPARRLRPVRNFLGFSGLDKRSLSRTLQAIKFVAFGCSLFLLSPFFRAKPYTVRQKLLGGM